MKTAISIPDEIFKEAERAAKKLGVSRSELYAKAVLNFVERYRREDLTEKLNEVYSEGDSISELDPHLITLQTNSLNLEKW
jgi:metal-responsive CopG/Arc/MetJ family transcriptional regulator